MTLCLISVHSEIIQSNLKKEQGVYMQQSPLAEGGGRVNLITQLS